MSHGHLHHLQEGGLHCFLKRDALILQGFDDVLRPESIWSVSHTFVSVQEALDEPNRPTEPKLMPILNGK